MNFKKYIAAALAFSAMAATFGCAQEQPEESSEPVVINTGIDPKSVVFDWQTLYENKLNDFKKSDAYSINSMFDLRDINADGPTVCILDPGGYLEIRDKISNRFTIYLDLPRDIRINRVLARGDDPEEVARREEDDDIMFGYLDERYQELCDLRIARERSIEDDVARIQRYLRAFNDGSINYDGRPGE